MAVFEINQDLRLRSGAKIPTVLWGGGLCEAPTPRVLIRKSGWQATTIRFNLPDIHQISCPFNLPAVWGGIPPETHKLEAKVSLHSLMTRWQNLHEAWLFSLDMRFLFIFFGTFSHDQWVNGSPAWIFFFFNEKMFWSWEHSAKI